MADTHSADDENRTTRIADAFVRALVLNTNPQINKAHETAPCPVVMWEDGHSYTLDNEIIRLKGNNDN